MTSSASVISNGVYHQSFCTNKFFSDLLYHSHCHPHSLMSCVFSTVFYLNKEYSKYSKLLENKDKIDSRSSDVRKAFFRRFLAFFGVLYLSIKDETYVSE